jgi:hypothetical protein
MVRVEALTRGRSEARSLAMSAIPLHLQRRFELKWASRFSVPVAVNAPKNAEAKATPTTPAFRPAKTKEKPVGVNRRALSLSHERLLQRGVDRGELGVQVGAEAVDHSDDREGDAGSDQSIFDGGSASLVLQEAGKKLGHKGESPG